jgi:hypothetical protein
MLGNNRDAASCFTIAGNVDAESGLTKSLSKKRSGLLFVFDKKGRFRGSGLFANSCLN